MKSLDALVEKFCKLASDEFDSPKLVLELKKRAQDQAGDNSFTIAYDPDMIKRLGQIRMEKARAISNAKKANDVLGLVIFWATEA